MFLSKNISMNKVSQIETFLKNIIKYQDFFGIDAFFDNIPESCILTYEDLRSVIDCNNEIIVLGPDFYTHHEILNNTHPNIIGNMFSIHQGYAVSGNDSSHWYKINEDLSEYITTLNLEMCNQLFNDQLI